jgi:hypothetical protein
MRKKGNTVRKAYIGFSTPIGYNYKYRLKSGKPNPILDSPLGLFLFYDELWFLERSLCPQNMTNLPYVYFLDEEYDLSNFDLSQFSWDQKEVMNLISKESQQKAWNSQLKSIQVNADEDWEVDVHSRWLSIGNGSSTPKPSEYNLMLDDYISSQFDLDLITNSYTSFAATEFIPTELSRQLAHLVIVDNIPNFQFLEGPYHPLIEELRSDGFLVEFKKKITHMSSGKNLDDLKKISSDLKIQFDDYSKSLISRALSKKRIYKGIADFVLGQIVILSNIYSALDGGNTIYNAINDRKSLGWAGFMANIKTHSNEFSQ